ncbi:MAG: TolC family protein [Proteobacteria bacterium]|nr:TolC family protein [Pseudomonadota bacterium]
MNIYYPFFIAFTLVVSLSQPMGSFAMETPGRGSGLSLLIKEAFEKNQDIKAMESAIDSLRSKASFEGALTDPQIGFSLSNVPIDSLSFRDEAMTQKQIFVGQKFPWPGKRALKSQSVDFDAKKLEHQLRSKKLSMIRTLTENYYDLGFIGQSLVLNRNIYELVQKLIQVAETRYTSGKGNRQDILMARMELDKREDERIMLENAYRQIEDRINGLLNRSNYLPVAHNDTPGVSESLPHIPDLVEQALENNPELAVLKLDIEKNKAQRMLAQKDYYPDVDMRLTYGQRDDDPMGKTRTDFVSLSAGLSIPLWKHSRQDKNLAAQESAVQSATLKLRNLQSRIPHDVDRLATDIRETIRRYTLYTNKLIPTAKDIARSAQSDYEVGKSEFSTLISSQIKALTLELEATNFLFLIKKKRAELNELVGLPLTPNTLTRTMP